MSRKTQTVEAVIQLTKENCYYMCHGVCSLNVVQGVFVQPVDPVPPNHLLFCPLLSEQMAGGQNERVVPVAQCACGHIQVLGRHQRACVAERKGIPLAVEWKDKQARCRVCGDRGGDRNPVGTRVLPLETVSGDSSEETT